MSGIRFGSKLGFLDTNYSPVCQTRSSSPRGGATAVVSKRKDSGASTFSLHFFWSQQYTTNMTSTLKIYKNHKAKLA